MVATRAQEPPLYPAAVTPEVVGVQRNRRLLDSRLRGHGGFTLIELLVVMAVVALLLTLALPRYFQSIDVSKETILIENLRVTRDAIDKFYADTGRYPDSLEELVDRKYLRTMPFDPVAEAANRWAIVSPPGDAKGNVYDLKSGAEGNARSGKPFSEL